MEILLRNSFAETNAKYLRRERGARVGLNAATSYTVFLEIATDPHLFLESKLERNRHIW